MTSNQGGPYPQHSEPYPYADPAEPAEPADPAAGNGRPRHAEWPNTVPPAGDMPTGAGLVPPRLDALPPTPWETSAPTFADPAPGTAGPPPTTPLPTSAPPPAAPPATAPPAAPPPSVPPPTAPPASALPPSATSAPPVTSPAGGQHAASPPPRPEDLLLPDRPAVDAQPATWGWRGRMRRLSAGAISPKASPAELAYRQDQRDIQHGFSRPMTVVVIQPKGGAGKTPTTVGLASALGSHRGGYVVGWDDNETRGTLAVRVANTDGQHSTVWDLLGRLPDFERADARIGDLSYFVRPQGEAQFDAVVSDDSPGNMAQIGEEEFHRIHAVLQRFYRMIVIDTGNNVRSPNWQAAVNAADVVVVVSTYQRDVGYSGSWVLDHLSQTGREDLARQAVTVLTAADPTVDKTVRGELLRHFRVRTQAVVEIPFDPQIALGGPIRWGELAEATRRAWVHAGATVVRALTARDRRAP